MWDAITYPFLNFDGGTVEIKEWISNFTPRVCVCNYFTLLRLKLIHASKRGPSFPTAKKWAPVSVSMYNWQPAWNEQLLILNI